MEVDLVPGMIASFDHVFSSAEPGRQSLMWKMPKLGDNNDILDRLVHGNDTFTVLAVERWERPNWILVVKNKTGRLGWIYYHTWDKVTLLAWSERP